MPYRVRTKDGELSYPTIAELSQAWQLGMVDAEDEVLEDGKTMWRKAGTLPFLAQYSARPTPLLDRKVFWLVVLSCIAAMNAVYFVVHGRLQLGGLFALIAALTSIGLLKATYLRKK